MVGEYIWEMFNNYEHFLALFSNEMLVIMAGIHKMLVRIAKREDPVMLEAC